MRERWFAGAVLATVAAACSTTGIGHGVSVSPSVVVSPPDASPTESPAPTAVPDGPLETGGATVSTTGELIVQASLSTLVEPEVWGAPPAPMNLTWDDPTGQSLSLSGTSFASRATTAPDRTLAFVVAGPDGPAQFTSTNGECSVTITPALPESMGGVFTCTAITDVDGTLTVNASGTFSASG
ncbi:MAG TPA: hypothetical protein VE800_09560 [Actinomycetota bacterium]|nr:hypothetical protein [Actinomycetota bacterium]